MKLTNFKLCAHWQRILKVFISCFCHINEAALISVIFTSDVIWEYKDQISLKARLNKVLLWIWSRRTLLFVSPWSRAVKEEEKWLGGTGCIRRNTRRMKQPSFSYSITRLVSLGVWLRPKVTLPWRDQDKHQVVMALFGVWMWVFFTHILCVCVCVQLWWVWGVGAERRG